MIYKTGGMLGWRWLLAGSMASAGILLVTAPLVASAQASPEAIAMQSSSNQGVTVKVTPKSIGLPDKLWEFDIVLDTHSASLSDELTQSATLRADDGRTFKPTGWLGAPAGGHHREGVLAFNIPAPKPGSIELSIVRPGESTPRTFRWQL